MTAYDKPPELYDGLRLHQNENTGGCSPRVLEALARLRPTKSGSTPLCRRDARVRSVPGRRAGSPCADQRPRRRESWGSRWRTCGPPVGGPVPEALVPEPAFEIFRVDAEVVGGHFVQVMPKPDFTFALDEVLAAITPRTRVVFLTNPNNPTGVSMPLEAIRQIARRVPKEAVVFVDEAYAEFAGTTFISELPAFPNVIVGPNVLEGIRPRRPAHRLSRRGAGVLDPVRAVIPVYSVNIAAVVAVQAALADPAYLRDYLRQVNESKALLYAACDRVGLKYWKSDANFVLVCAGDRLRALVNGAADRGIYIRDRSSEPGCAGCLRVATGIVEHTRRFIAAMEEVLCAAP